MLPELVKHDGLVTLIENTGVQFLDFAFDIQAPALGGKKLSALKNTFFSESGQNWRLLFDGLQSGNEQLLFHQPDGGVGVYPGSARGRDEQDVSLATTLELFNGLWLPIPYVRFVAPHRYDTGPASWSRIRVVKLEAPDRDGNTHRITVACDTSVVDLTEGAAYLAPLRDDVNAGALFRLACDSAHMDWFLDRDWVQEWLEEVYTDNLNKVRSIDFGEEVSPLRSAQLHFLNLLSLFAHPHDSNASERKEAWARIPDIKVLAANWHSEQVIPVDLVLDVGNSRTCGILIENHGQDDSGLRQNYVLQLRDLSKAHQIYSKPFESRVEFAQVDFGKNHLSLKSGRPTAFSWPTLVRVGDEAARLAARRRGTEGTTGLSSPKRYLWDENEYKHGWRFSQQYDRSDAEPRALAAPFSLHIDERGEALYTLDEDDRLPVFEPLYSRSSVMTFMLTEVLAQALLQINSPAQRARQGHSNKPRRLSNIVLTVPPGMPLVERSLLSERLRQAIGLLWTSMNWYQGEEDPYGLDATGGKPDGILVPLPEFRVEWDEATCSQLVYLFTEITQNFAGHADEFFDAVAAPHKKDRETLTLGIIDIGGGTTDIVISDYTLRRPVGAGGGSNVTILPQQRFRDSFRVAGDDVLLDVIQQHILPAFEQALINAGVDDTDVFLSRLCGNEKTDARKAILRQQLALQVFVPLGLEFLKRYESYDPHQDPCAVQAPLWRELLAFEHLQGNAAGQVAFDAGDQRARVSATVAEYVAQELHKHTGHKVDFDFSQVAQPFDLGHLHQSLITGSLNINDPLRSFCEVLSYYDCDIILMAGRPSRLPGIQAYVRSQMPVSPSRLLPLHNYRTGSWYPFHTNGRINDPKSTASVGAMLCLLCYNMNIDQFNFKVSGLKPRSTLRHIGIIDSNNQIKNQDVVFKDALRPDPDTREEVLELESISSEDTDSYHILMQGNYLRLGYRQLNVERWPASPLYYLYLDERVRRQMAEAPDDEGQIPAMEVSLQRNEKLRDRRGRRLISDRLEISAAAARDFKLNIASKTAVKIQLNTMLEAGLGDTPYWLDSGSVVLK
ncbi:virulence factor SrfB [Alcaligenes sp. SDU_A2]|uniref:virulence factor SrfB n=1 Tax=Alcaligenes sp. SDU_A2 TaxID=3136634 RepID=UPI00311DCD22